MFHAMDNMRMKYNDVAYAIFRALVGILFTFHGAQKLFGFLSKNGAVPLMSKLGVAGVIEFVGGILIILGLLTVPVAIIAALEMLVAYILAHAPSSPWPIVSGGELSLLYFAAFLFIAFEGGGWYSLDTKFCKKCEKEHK
jgi:putative oxidoreductase